MSVPVAIKTEEVIVENAEYNSAEELEDDLHLQLEDSGGESYHVQFETETHTTPTSKRQHNSAMGSGGKNSSSSSVANNSSSHKSSSGVGNTNKSILESEKRMRREIANSNERRRMQSINAGFQNLRQLLPRHEGEKLSKAAILQQTSQYICELENQKTQLLAQNSQLKRQLGLHESSSVGSGGGGDTANGGTNGSNANSNNSDHLVTGVAMKKRKLTDNIINIQTISDSSDEGLGSMSPEPMTLLNAGTNTKTQVLSGATIIAQHSTKEKLELMKQLEKERKLRTMLEDELQAIKRQLYSVATAPPSIGGTSYIPREVIEHTDNFVREVDELPAGTVSYVEIDEVTGQQQVVVCSSIEELDSEAAAAADIITEDNVHEEIILSSNSSTESEHEVNAIAKAYAEGTSPNAVLQPILQAAIKATPKVEVERINEALVKVKTEKIEQPSGLTRSRQNLETIVEAIRHLEGDHLFGDVVEQQKLHQQKAQEAPLALTNKQQQAQRTTLAELRPFLHLKGNKQVTIVGGSGAALTLTHSQLAAATKNQKDLSGNRDTNVTPTAIYKVQTSGGNSGGNSGHTTAHIAGNISSPASTSSSVGAGAAAQHITITTTSLKQCRPGVIVAKQLS